LKLEVHVTQTLADVGILDATVEKVAVDREIEHYLTGEPPLFVIDEQLVWSGGKELPTKAQIAEWVREVQAALA
jgi:hypothetical protein